MYARISNPLKQYSIHIFPHATNPVSKEISLKGRLGTNSSKTLFEGMIKNFQNNSKREVTQKGFYKIHFQKFTLKTES